jgi:hypothetical protein
MEKAMKCYGKILEQKMLVKKQEIFQSKLSIKLHGKETNI